MAYTVLARKYRSRTFDEVIGQEPIAATLANAVRTGRIHHGFLFTGTRGSGKTSMARILAKSLNCLAADAPTVSPCLKCDACTSIAEGQDLDVVEIDAASNTGVDNIRELRSNAAFRPARSRFNIYIIDEVHMLSTGAFNALLKTLEEPPAHVKFILATTEIQKVPATIQSRCQRFNFRNIAPDAIAARLEFICQQEGIRADQAVVRRVARLANGSMRDALSMLDQLISVSSDHLSADVLDEILPPTQDEQVFRLLAQAAEGDVRGVLTTADELFSSGRSTENFCNDIIDILRTLMLLRTCGADTAVADVPAAARAEYVALSARFEVSQYVQLIAMFEELRRNVRYSGAGRALTDALLVRVAHMRDWAPIERVLAQLPPAAAPPGADEKKKRPVPLTPPAPVATDVPPVRAPRSNEPSPPIRAVPASRLVPPNPAYDNAAAAALPAMRCDERTATSPAPPADANGPAVAVALPRAAVAEYPDEDELLDEPPPEYAARHSPGAEPGVAHRSLTSEERARVLRDPVVQQVLDLFDGVIVNVDRAAAPPADAAEP